MRRLRKLFVFARRELNSAVDDSLFGLEDFDSDKVDWYFLHCRIDLGRSHVFIVTIALSVSGKEIGRCSSKERACYADTAKRAIYTEKLKQQQGIKPIESHISSTKTIDLEKMDYHVQYMLRHITALFKFYSTQSLLIFTATKADNEQMSRWQTFLLMVIKKQKIEEGKSKWYSSFSSRRALFERITKMSRAHKMA
ncbi:hypothetical protein BCV72DRAFT_233585 [Rhizopus microsporus var. microsporus]|uniref:Uncharacterized protein n=2 Tax=Rhizopus microsporus TaxID=58291 RepID=A0A2G4SWU3_RHIZD|nr:uncharacterized protein RHIMIDRAFT_281799 [Rhizopus microsporus ATCC 52813]ORE03106.1 hypothetical protein BCV72DRAFT_233585 [Rhizopus microsporus var. microsporus]PHZ13253.1 hypothetical protein RHIMIDRAFT_281799 [Rhizopus microsporus ATCC 52813]